MPDSAWHAAVDVTDEVTLNAELCAAVLELADPAARMAAALPPAIAAFDRFAGLETRPQGERAEMQQYADKLRMLLQIVNDMHKLCAMAADVMADIRAALDVPAGVARH